jgi:hypothetical protein
MERVHINICESPCGGVNKSKEGHNGKMGGKKMVKNWYITYHSYTM